MDPAALESVPALPSALLALLESVTSLVSEPNASPALSSAGLPPLWSPDLTCSSVPPSMAGEERESCIPRPELRRLMSGATRSWEYTPGFHVFLNRCVLVLPHSDVSY
jgi:hypothetical protein